MSDRPFPLRVVAGPQPPAENAVRAPPNRDARPAGNILSIETGFNCNAFCGFCPQLNYRDDPEISLDLSTEEIKERIRFGAANGYRQIGFSGGESTIRKDFIEIVAYSKQHNYDLIAVTTNGMMFSYPQFAYQAIKAGLNSINISVHGNTAKLHDAMMRTPGSFDLAIKGLENIQAVKRKLNVRVDMMSMCLASPQVIDAFPEQVRLMGKYGIKLHMLQPFLLTKGNTHLARFFFSDWEKIQWAIREGAKVAKEHGGHIKLFNIPICFFWDIEEQIERQWKKLDVFREHERREAGELHLNAGKSKRFTPLGFYRIDACETCTENCNGLRAEYYPQQLMVEEINAATDAHLARYGGEHLTFSGFELQSAESIRQVLQHAREKGARRITLMTGGIGRAYAEQFDAEILGLVDELCFVPHRETKSNDPHHSHGNFEDLEKGLSRVKGAAQLNHLRLSATVVGQHFLKNPDLMEFLRQQGILNVVIGVDEDFATLLETGARPAFTAAMDRYRAQGFTFELAGDEQRLRAPLELLNYRPRFVRHRWASREFSWILWSVPNWLAERDPRSAVEH